MKIGGSGKIFTLATSGSERVTVNTVWIIIALHRSHRNVCGQCQLVSIDYTKWPNLRETRWAFADNWPALQLQGLISFMDRALHLVIAKVMVHFPVSSNFFRFFSNCLYCSYNCQDHIHFQNYQCLVGNYMYEVGIFYLKLWYLPRMTWIIKNALQTGCNFMHQYFATKRKSRMLFITAH